MKDSTEGIYDDTASIQPSSTVNEAYLKERNLKFMIWARNFLSQYCM